MSATQPLMLRSWPRAILHLDADAFFVSVEQALHPELRGKPVITGAERGIVAAASYEAKALGIQRGVSLTEAARLCPKLIMLPSDYETYSIYSKRIFEIMRRFTPDVEEYSIDEAFADLSGLRRLYPGDGYQGIAKKIQETVIRELDIGVSVGVSLTKSLAKLGSKFRKPRGFTAVPGQYIHVLLAHTPLEKIWGVGPNTAALLRKHGCRTALDFVQLPRYVVEDRLGKVGIELWSELRGEAVFAINPAPKTTYGSISKTKTFSPSSTDPQLIFAHALRNLESACIKARRYDLGAHRLMLTLRTQQFTSASAAVTLSRATNSPLNCTDPLRGLFDQLFQSRQSYRATGVVLADLGATHPTQFDLFEDPARTVRTEQTGAVIDDVNARYGKHTLFLSEGLHLGQRPADRIQSGRRGQLSRRVTTLLPGETTRRHLALPRWQTEKEFS